MDTIITSDQKTENGRYIDATCGKTSVSIFIWQEQVRVIVKNASHKAWRGMGKGFPDFAAAIANYKSAEMKSILFSVSALVN